MRRVTITALSASLLLAGCSSTARDGGEDFLTEHGLPGDAVQIVDHLEKLGGDDRPTDLMASVRPDHLVLSDADDELQLPLPEDRFYLSIAPYSKQTHDCFFHSLTTCQGELAREDVHVKIVDKGTGDVLVDEETVTNPNGFVGFWLPKDVDATVEVAHAGQTGQQHFSTREGDATCMTTLQLA